MTRHLILALTLALLSGSHALADTKPKKDAPPRVVFIESQDMT